MGKKKSKPDKNKVKKEAIIKSLAGASSITDACRKADIGRDAFYRWLITDKKFKEDIKVAQDSRVGVVEDALFISAVKDKNVTAQIFLLCNRAKDFWHNVNKVEHSGSLNQNITYKIIDARKGKTKNVDNLSVS